MPLRRRSRLRRAPLSQAGGGGLPATNESILVGNDLVTVRAADSGLSDGALRTSIVNNYGSGIFNQYYSSGGAFQTIRQGGHGDPNTWDDYALPVVDPITSMSWERNDNANGIVQSVETYGPVFVDTETNGAPYYEMDSSDPAGHPAVPHTYFNYCLVPGGTNSRGTVYLVASAALDSGGNLGSQSIHEYDVHTRVWSRSTNNLFAMNPDKDSSNAYDPTTGRIYFIPPNLHSYSRMEYLRLSDMTIQQINYSAGFAPTVGSGGYRIGFIYLDGRMLLYHGTGGLIGLDITSDSTIAQNWVELDVSGTVPDADKSMWVWHKGRFWKRQGFSGNVLEWLQPPATSPMTNQWTTGTVTVGGDGLPDSPGSNGGYRSLYHIESINMLGLTAHVNTNGTAIINVESA